MTPSSQHRYVFTSESVSDGHPDKICDIISDVLVDLYLAQDPQAKLAIETVVSKNRVILVGEINSTYKGTAQDREKVVRECLQEIGYEEEHFHYANVIVEDFLHSQSADIAQGVDLEDGLIGAGDQGMMIGYATDETPGYLPAPLFYSHRILEAISSDRKKGFLPQLGPDAKVQLSVEYGKNGPERVKSIVLSHQHKEAFETQQVRELLMPYVESVLPKGWMPKPEDIHVNPTGRFVIGGPVGDSGLTGRKIIVDTYGSAAAHGGGAFSGKDPTKVDRSGAYMARYLAKNIVAAGLARRCTIQISYGIGLTKPLSLYVKLHGTGKVPVNQIESYIQDHVDLTPVGLIKTLGLRRPMYKNTASYGHFGRTIKDMDWSKDPRELNEFPWESLNLVEALKHFFHNQKVMES